MVADFVIEEPEDFLAITLVDYYDHIQTTCTKLFATNKDLKKSLYMARVALHDPTTSYIVEINKKPNIVAALKASLTNALVDGYVLLEQGNDWLGKLAMKKQPVYPLRQQFQQCIIDSETCRDKGQLKQIDDNIASLEARVQQIKEESTETKNKIQDLRPPIYKHVRALKEVCDDAKEQ